MEFEKPPKIEQIGKNRKRLLSLEKEGKYVFHGSPDIIDVLKPRQAFNRRKKTGQMKKDGEPAIFATPYADVAIFKALINTKDAIGESTSQFGIDGNELHFSATKNLLNQAKKKIGRVYILDKKLFQNFEGMQCRSDESINPIEVIEVTVDDLPQNIETIDE
jgi:hypothetical protein